MLYSMIYNIIHMGLPVSFICMSYCRVGFRFSQEANPALQTLPCKFSMEPAKKVVTQKECPPKEWMGVSSVHLHTKSCAGSLAFFRSFLVRYLGGTLQLISLPGYGALAFLFIGGWEGSGVVTQCFNRARRKVELA